MNALRFYIRQSLLHEAVGQATWIRTARKVIGYKDVETPQAPGEAESALIQNLKSGVSALWTVGSAALPIRRGPTLYAAASKAWSSTSARGIASVIGVGGAALALTGGKTGATDAEKKEATDKVADFYIEVAAATNKKMRNLSVSLQTPGLATSTDDLAAAIQKVETNYREKTDELLRSDNYDNFFTNFRGYNDNVKGEIDTIVGNYANNEDSKRTSLQKLAFTYLLVHCADMMQVALGDDTKLLEARGLRNNEDAKSKLDKIYKNTFNSISNDEDIKAAKKHIDEIVGAPARK